MSSLAASKSDNFYYPPEWRPEYGGISKFQGSKGSNQYEKYGIIRFELPFDAWCLHCKRHMSKGLRFNAKKEHTGDYYSTRIYSFTTKCYSCDQQFIIRTNPQERTYDFVEGLRKHEQDYVPDKEDGAITILPEEEKLKIANDPMYKLQHVNEDEYRARTAMEQLLDLQELQQTVSKKDYDINALLRKKNRSLKHQENKQLEEGRKLGYSFPLLDLPDAKEDESYQQKLHTFQLQKKYKKDEIVTQEILRGNVLSSDQRKVLSSQSIFSSSKKDTKDTKVVKDVKDSQTSLRASSSSNKGIGSSSTLIGSKRKEENEKGITQREGESTVNKIESQPIKKRKVVNLSSLLASSK